MKTSAFLRRLLSILFVLVLCFTFIPTGTAYAAVKISKAKATMEVDSTLKLKVTGTTKKITWSSSKKSVATVSNAGTITAKAEGEATITAKVASKKYTCKVTVVDSNKKIEAFNPKTIAKQIKVVDEYTWSTDYNNYIAIVIKNNSKYVLEPSIQLKLKDSSGKTVGVKNDSENAFGIGSEMVFIFGNDEVFSDYEYVISAKEETYYKDVVSKLAVDVTTTDNKAIVEITNNGKKDAQFVEYSILYFRNDKVVDYGWGYCVDNDSEIKVGSTEFDEDTVYGTIFDDVKVYLTGRGK